MFEQLECCELAHRFFLYLFTKAEHCRMSLLFKAKQNSVVESKQNSPGMALFDSL